MQYLVTLLFLQSSFLAEEGIESWLLFFNCLPAVLWLCMLLCVGKHFLIVVHVFPGQTHFLVISSTDQLFCVSR